MVSSRSSSPVTASMMRTSRSWTRSRTWVPAWVRPMPMWCSRPARRRVTQPVLSILSVRTRSWGSALRSGPGGGLGGGGGAGAGGVGGGRGGPLRQRAGRAVLVVGVDEEVDEGLQVGDRGRLEWLGSQPLLQGLLEAFDLAAGGRMVRAGVLLCDVEPAQVVLGVVAAAAAGGAGGGGGAV